jgi:hypothetical protein
VARAHQFEAIEAYVTEVVSAVRLTTADFRRARWTRKGRAQPAGAAPPRRLAAMRTKQSKRVSIFTQFWPGFHLPT